MIWAAISYFDTSDVHLLEGSQDSRDYCSVLQTTLLPFATESNGHNWVLQHDNAPIHCSNYTKNWLSNKGVSVLD